VRSQGTGRQAASVVRGTLDHVDLRPVRGERPLLPVAAARAVRRGPGGRAGGRTGTTAAGVAAAQRHDLPGDAAFYYGALRALSEDDRPLWTQMSFAAAQTNFQNAARSGMTARLYWPGIGTITADELVLRA